VASSEPVSLPVRRWQALADQQGTGLDEDEGEAVSLDKQAQAVAGVVKRVEAGAGGGMWGRQAGAVGRGHGQGAEVPRGTRRNGRGVAATAGGRLLATAGNEGKVRLWDAGAREELARVELVAPGWSVALDPGRRCLAAGDRGGAVKVWAVARLLRKVGGR
jgi:hypothetical protein